MNKPARLLLLLPLLVIAPPVFNAASAEGQEIPAGVRYKKAPDALSAAAMSLLEEAVADPTKMPEKLLAGVVTCGPMLWQDLRPSANELLQRSKASDSFLQVPNVVHVEERSMMDDDQRRAFWTAVTGKYGLKGAKIRKPTADEIRYFWATISFDIEEPLFTIDTGSDRFIANFLVENGKLHLFWLDRVGELRSLKGAPVAAKDADTAALDFAEEKTLPQGWKRYRYTYDGGDTLTFVMPSEPKEYTQSLQLPTQVPIALTMRNLSANASQTSFNALYVTHLSRTAAELSDQEKGAVFTAMIGGFVNGLIKSIKQGGGEANLQFGKPRAITLSGHPGAEQNLSIPPFEGRAECVIVDANAYGALVVWKGGTPDDSIKLFLDSFRIEH